MKIDIRQLSFAYNAQSPVFHDFSWQAAAGDSWSIIGPSGCGKSTLLYLLAGLNAPSKGTIRIDGNLLARPRPKTGLVLQDHGLLPWATVEANARLGLTIWKFYGPDDRHAPTDAVVDANAADARVKFWLERLGISDHRNKYPGQLSRGQRQRTAIARTLAMQPDLLLLDEPFSALDAPTREDLHQIMDDLMQEYGLTRVLVTHDIDEAIRMGEHILVLPGKRNREPQIIDNDCARSLGRCPEENHRHQHNRIRTMLGDVI